MTRLLAVAAAVLALAGGASAQSLPTGPPGADTAAVATEPVGE